MDDLLQEIRRALPYGTNPEFVDDIVSDLVILVIEERIPRANLKQGIREYIGSVRGKYRWGSDVSLEQPIGDGATKLEDVIVASANPAQHCPKRYCRNKVKPGRTYCSPVCAYQHYAYTHRMIDPAELKYLHKVQKLPRKKSAQILGVTIHGINNVISRKKLARNDKLPDTCKVNGCNDPAVHFRHCSGWLAGNLCKKHKADAQRQYTRAYKLRKGWIPKTKEERSKQAGEAGTIRWARTAEIRAQKKTDRRDEIEARKKAQTERTHCANGHPWNEANTYMRKSGGKRACRRCQADHQAAYRAKKK